MLGGVVALMDDPAESKQKTTTIRNLEAERLNLQNWINWTSGELNASRNREKEGLAVMRSFREALGQPAEILLRTQVGSTRIPSEGTLTDGKILSILVAYQAKMEGGLKEFWKLVEELNPDKVLDYSTFPDVPAAMPELSPRRPSSAPIPTKRPEMGPPDQKSLPAERVAIFSAPEVSAAFAAARKQTEEELGLRVSSSVPKGAGTASTPCSQEADLSEPG